MAYVATFIAFARNDICGRNARFLCDSWASCQLLRKELQCSYAYHSPTCYSHSV